MFNILRYCLVKIILKRRELMFVENGLFSLQLNDKEIELMLRAFVSKEAYNTGTKIYSKID